MSQKELILRSGMVEMHFCLYSGKMTSMSACLPSGEKAPLFVSEPSDSHRGSPVHASDIFDIRSAWGSDECFPSVGAHPECGMRDHGWIWGAFSEMQQLQNGVSHKWQIPGDVVFKRNVFAAPSADGVAALFCFEVTHPRFVKVLQSDLSCLGVYASHALFSVDEGDVLEICSEADSQDGQKVFWRGEFPNSTSPVARKFFVTGGKKLSAHLMRKKLGIRVKVNCEDNLPHLGIWWCNNAWGDGRPHQTIGIEPTNALSDGPIFQKDSHPGNQGKVTGRYSYEISLIPKERLLTGVCG
jgi:hypothetical protein